MSLEEAAEFCIETTLLNGVNRIVRKMVKEKDLVGDVLEENKVPRQTRKRIQTRNKIIVAARQLYTRQSIDSTTINEITEQADVGFGTFYNHFKSKEELTREVFSEHANDFVKRTENLVTKNMDPALVLSLQMRRFLRAAVADPEFGILVLKADEYRGDTKIENDNQLDREIKRCIDKHAVNMGSVKNVIIFINGIMRSALQSAIKAKKVNKKFEQEMVEFMLRGIGICQQDAEHYARHPVPADE